MSSPRRICCMSSGMKIGDVGLVKSGVGNSTGNRCRINGLKVGSVGYGWTNS